MMKNYTCFYRVILIVYLIWTSCLFLWAKQVSDCPSDFVVATLYSSKGQLWVATVDKGLQLFKDGKQKWEKVKGLDFLDSPQFICLLEDRDGRIWVGTSNQGLVVWNGKTWKHYNRENTLLGERVECMAVSPYNGDVAVATSGGLSIYSSGEESWKDYTRAIGLPEDQITSLQFTKDGKLWAAFLTQGIACAYQEDGYRTWHHFKGCFDKFSKFTPDHTNYLCLHKDKIWVATTSGLACYYDNNYRLIRGRDSTIKEFLVKKDSSEEKNQKYINRFKENKNLLPEDYVTCILPSERGLWLGFREKGVCHLDLLSKKIYDCNSIELRTNATISKAQYVTSLVNVPRHGTYAAIFGHGLIRVGDEIPSAWEILEREEVVEHPKYPEPLRPRILWNQLEKNKVHAGVIEGHYWYDDWCTQGDWCGKYGDAHAMLCGISRNKEYQTSGAYDIVPWIGLYQLKINKGIKHKTIVEHDPKDRNIFYCPEDTSRWLACWDDGTELISRFSDGPDLSFFVATSPGNHKLSLYFYDPTSHKDGELDSYGNDFIIDIYKCPIDFVPRNYFWDENREATEKEIREIKSNFSKYLIKLIQQKPIVSTRVKFFATNGVYKNFIINGTGGYYFVHIKRNYSSKCTLNGIFVSPLNEKRKLVYRSDKSNAWYFFSRFEPYSSSLMNENFYKNYPDVAKLWVKFQNLQYADETLINQSRQMGLYCYRFIQRNNKWNETKRAWRWRLNIMKKEDRKDFDRAMKKIWLKMQERYPEYRSREWAKYAIDTTVPFSIDEVNFMNRKGIDWKTYLPNSKKKPVFSIKEIKEMFIEWSEKNKDKRK